MKVHSAGLTDIGRKRENNEDSFYNDDRVGLYIVADGMGGHRAGEVASSTVVSSVKDYMEAFHTSPVGQEAKESNMSPAARAVCHSIELANRVVYQLSQDQGSYRGMGSTAAVAYFNNDTLVTANVGDSRIYLIREEGIEQLTQDHTLLAEQMRKNPDWDPNTASIPMKHILVRAVGIHESVKADVYEMQPLPGDLLLMCSDGLTDMLSDKEIYQTVLQGGELAQVCSRLVSMANARGGLDNITTVVLLVQQEGKRLLQKIFRSK